VISYAQNFEDVMLARAFRERARGFYIDVGAMDPVADSVTCHFYELGWHGINVEPAALHFQRIAAARPRDLNLNLALGEREEVRDFFEVPDSGLSSLGDGRASGGAAMPPTRVTVPGMRVTTLAKIWAEHVGGRTVDFLKIDVEGWERQVIAGGDWRRFRPRIVVVEATRPNSQEPAWEDWEPILLESDYLFAWFDGLNRFYVRGEEAELLRHFSVPPNVFDGFVPWDVERLTRERDRARAEHARLSESHLRLAKEHARAIDELGREARRRMELESETAAIHRSTSWRITAPLRWLAERLGRRGPGSGKGA
jgi:FkbM family methyltransferase